MTRISIFFRKPYDFHFSIEKLFRIMMPLLQSEAEILEQICPWPSRGLWPRIKALRWAAKCTSDVNHITGDVHYLALALPSRNTVLTIHDLGFTRHPNPVARFILWLFWIYLPVHRVKAVTTISQASKNDIIRYAHCRPDKIRIIPNFVPPGLTYVPKSFQEEMPVILQVGTKFNKNMERVIKALSGITCHFRIIGKLSATQKQLMDTHGLDYSQDSGLSDKALVQEYLRCDMVTFCSTLEGFGMVILEAQAIGRPVVTSNLSSMPEVAGEGACLVDPYDEKDIRRGILKVLNNHQYRQNLIQSGLANCKKYALDKVAAQYLQLYKEIAHPSGHSLR